MTIAEATFAPNYTLHYHCHNWVLKLKDDWLLDADNIADQIIAVCTDPKCGKVLSRSQIEGVLNHD